MATHFVRQPIFIGANKVSEFTAKVSGTNQILKCGIRKNGTAFAQIPIKNDLSSFKQISKNIFQIELDGITHLVIEQDKKLTADKAKAQGNKILEKYKLKEKYPACGIMFISEQKGKIKLNPVVYVKSINTLFYETACGSGTTAVGIYLLLKGNLNLLKTEVVQPSGMKIKVKVKKNKNKLIYAEIEGEVIKLI